MRIVVLSLDYTNGTIPTTRKRAVANALALNQRVAERAFETLLHYCFESHVVAAENRSAQAGYGYNVKVISKAPMRV